MSSTDGEDAMRQMTDKATYERLQKDVEAVKNDISALADQISDVIEAFKGDARKQAHRNARDAADHVAAESPHQACARMLPQLACAQHFGGTGQDQTRGDEIARRFAEASRELPRRKGGKGQRQSENDPLPA